MQLSFQHHPAQSICTTLHASKPSSQAARTLLPPGTNLIGKPIHFVTGQFAGQTIRAELQEIQKADLGRKYARVDRRPLDPPPVVLLRLFHVYETATQRQEEEVRNYDEIQGLGLLCTVDLFPVSGPDSSHKDGKTGQPSRSALPNHSYTTSSTSQNLIPDARGQNFTFVNSQPYSQNPSQSIPSVGPARDGLTVQGYLPPSPSTSDVVHRVGDFPITERSKVTSALVGATFVQPATVEYQGRKSLVFVFADLAVKIEGTFILRYRMFDIFSKPYQQEHLVIQAENYGGPFRVYSTKEFPGLQASTELTKQLARWGVRLNIRETERKRRKKEDARSTSPQPIGQRIKGGGDNSDNEE